MNNTEGYFRTVFDATYHGVRSRSAAQLLWNSLDAKARERLTSIAYSRSVGVQKEEDDFSLCFATLGGTVGMWMALHEVATPRAVIQIGRLVNLLSEPDYRLLDREISKTDPTLPPARQNTQRPENDADDPDDRIEEARYRRDLLLVNGNGTRKLFWKGNLAETGIVRRHALWEFLCKLVGQAQDGRELSWDLVNRDRPDTITKHRSRLKKVLPPEIDKLIVKGIDARCYRFDLPSESVELLELEGDDLPFLSHD